MRHCVLLFFLFISSLSLLAQKSFGERSELGFQVGGSYYTGDLNRMGHFQQVSLAGGIIYRYNVNPRFALRSTALVGQIKGNDAKSKNEYFQNRNLNFNSILIEGSFGVEFNYLTYVTGRTYGERYWLSSYMFAQLAGFYFNPKTEFEGNSYELQPLGTEGQGTSLSNESNYNRFQLSMPLGLGFKMNLSKKVQFFVEYGIRLTFTDHLDDVSGTYVDPNELAAINGHVAAQLSDRSLNPMGSSGRNTGMRRGDGAYNDWYAFFGAGITFKLRQRPKCAYGNNK
jgi:hypothetical protein